MIRLVRDVVVISSQLRFLLWRDGPSLPSRFGCRYCVSSVNYEHYSGSNTPIISHW